MTLILSCITPDHVLQVSDRRLSWPDGRVDTDDANKCVWFCGRMIFGYTGQAEIARQPTDLWMLKILSRAQGLDGAVTTLAQQATRAFQVRFAAGQHPPHAFEAVAWARFPPSTRYEPFICGISNFHDGSGQRLPRVSDGFSVWVERLGHGRPVLTSTVSVLSPSDESKLARTLSKVVRRGLHPDALATLLVDQLLALARPTGPIGPGLIAGAIPRAWVESDRSAGVEALTSGPLEDMPTFFYVSADASERRQWGPRITCGGDGAMIEEIVTEPL